jgi:membrane glycosyltransferase
MELSAAARLNQQPESGRPGTTPQARDPEPDIAAYRLIRERLHDGGIAPGLIAQDDAGKIRLRTAPPINRTSIAPRPWQGNRLRKQQATPASAPGRLRRILLAALVLGQTVLASNYLVTVLPFHAGKLPEQLELVLFSILFGWISAGFWTAMMGFLLLLGNRRQHALWQARACNHPFSAGARTAVIMPICNENVHRVFAGLRASYESLARTGELHRFDFFVLSDSSDPDCRVAEQQAWLALCRAVDGFDRVFYRWRRHRIKHKSGNVADFCRRWGKDYRYAVVLDADSIMSGDCLLHLMQLMEANEDIGIVQTAPQAVGRDTPYARMQQFANRIYGPLFTAGLHFWQLGESHYWGHNAIIRLAPFMQHCSLARLRGRGALSGAILSHDFVEAALMRRAGWKVWIAHDLAGSYEEVPSNLIEELSRDRRWCQGNLMNFRLLLMPGLHPVHRAIFIIGALAYVSALLWFASLVLASTVLASQVLVLPAYYLEPYQIFPLWPAWHPERALTLLAATATLLYLPKILGIMLACLHDAKSFGGIARLLLSALAEMLSSMLLAPVRMLFHSYFVLAGLLGHRVQWLSPSREDAASSWRESCRRLGICFCIGSAWAAWLYWLNPFFLWWYLPIVGAMILAIPFSVFSSRARIGRQLRQAGLFLTPEEISPPPVLQRAMQLMERRTSSPGLLEAVRVPFVNAVTCACGNVRLQQSRAAVQARQSLLQQALTGGPDALHPRQRASLLDDPLALAQLHVMVHTKREVHAGWRQQQTRHHRENDMPLLAQEVIKSRLSESLPPVQ